MFSQTWKKYLPVIIILIKRSATSEQKISLNLTDFERAAGGRKIKFSFSGLQLNKGRVNNDVKNSPFAKEFAAVLQEDDVTKRLIADQYLEFSLNNQLEITIKNTGLLTEDTIESDLVENNQIIEVTGENEGE
jgi:hypothetical protein